MQIEDVLFSMIALILFGKIFVADYDQNHFKCKEDTFINAN